MATDAWLTLLAAAQGGPETWAPVLRAYGSVEALLADSARALRARGLSSESIEKLKSPDAERIGAWRKWLAGDKRALVTLDSSLYPARLSAIDDAPLALWIEGNEPSLLGATQLAIVGSRNPTTTGLETAESFAGYLAKRGLTITSGLATGIDSAAHRGSVGELGGTVAVLGSGIDIVYPRSNAELARKIVERGLIVSEYGPGVAPQKFFFPRRNRIIAALSTGTLVVEATRRSGSLITARFAAEFGREVFAIPGSIHNPLARGCHSLIRQGAKLVEEAADILVELAPQLSAQLDSESPQVAPENGSTSPAELDDDYQKLLDTIDFAPVRITTLRDRCQLTTAELSSMLLHLELQGLVEALPGGRYARLRRK